MSFFDGFGAGGVGPIGGASGPAVSGGSPVFQVAANDPGSILYDKFVGATVGGTQGITGTQVTVGVAAFAVGAALVAYFK